MRDEAFDRLFAGEFARCERLARRIVQDQSMAEELAAEAFARAWSRWSKLRDGSPSGWVLRVTANLAIDATRRRRPVASTGPQSVELEDAAAVRLALAAALRTLPRRQREAIALRYLADLTDEEVARVLGISAGSVKTHVHRGIQRLRTSLDWRHDPEVSLGLEP